MKRVGEPDRYITDPVEVKRTPFLVEASDVGKVQKKYLGDQEYTFQADDVGRLVEVVQNMSPGFMSWGFGSIFAKLRQQYPETKPYQGAPGAKEPA